MVIIKRLTKENTSSIRSTGKKVYPVVNPKFI